MVERTVWLHGKRGRVKLSAITGRAFLREDAAMAFARMASAAAAEGIILIVNYGWRSHALQAKLYAEYAAKLEAWAEAGSLLDDKPTSVARPGESKHEPGLAVDLDLFDGSTPRPAKAWLEEHAHEYEFYRTVPGELWHFEWTGAMNVA